MSINRRMDKLQYIHKGILLLLLLSHLSRVRLCETPLKAAHQAPPSLGFSRQEHWSGLPFPSPMHDSEKWKGSRSVMSNSLRPHGPQPTRLLCPWDFPGRSTGVECHCLLLNNKEEDKFDTVNNNTDGYLKHYVGTSLAIQWLRLHVPTVGGMGSIPGPGTKIPHAPVCPTPQQKNNNKINKNK